MNKTLNFLYLNPNHSLFKVLSICNKNQKTIIILSLMMIFLPLSYVFKTHFKTNKNILLIEEKINLLEAHKNVYNTLLIKQQTLNKQDENLTNINETIQNSAQRNHVNIISSQWNLTQNKIIELRASATSSAIFKFIAELSKLPNLKFTMLDIVKSDQDRIIELTTNLIIYTNEE